MLAATSAWFEIWTIICKNVPHTTFMHPLLMITKRKSGRLTGLSGVSIQEAWGIFPPQFSLFQFTPTIHCPFFTSIKSLTKSDWYKLLSMAWSDNTEPQLNDSKYILDPDDHENCFQIHTSNVKLSHKVDFWTEDDTTLRWLPWAACSSLLANSARLRTLPSWTYVIYPCKPTQHHYEELEHFNKGARILLFLETVPP